MSFTKSDDFGDNISNDNDIAIIGMSCRFPGAVNSPEEFWQFLLAGGDGIVEVPSDRWENKAYYDSDRNKKNKMYVNSGGFIKNIDKFDPLFFGISPKEAPQIDPQHRWLLELTYEAFENAGLKVSEFKGSDTAVYMGQFMHDYEQLILDSIAHDNMTSHSATGPSMTLTSNRISYLFDFTGPSVTLDTACSSSLVALDMACKAILNGDSNIAVAGGVNILLRPEITMSICKASMLSPDCRCKSFDASANGYVRSEGAGIVLIRKLSDALRDGNNILAVIKATGVNQDGQTIGITVPSGSAQQKLLVASLARAKIAAEDIQYAEAHGTGTAVGDPIEVNALGTILGNRSSDIEQCVIGSVKSNIGHTEAAAGMAGLIKTVMAMNHGVIPKNIHYHKTNPAINLQQLNIQIAGEVTEWPKTYGKLRHAVVNSFGFGGTNANVVLQQAPLNKIKHDIATAVVDNKHKLLFISSKTEKGLRDQAIKMSDFFKSQIDSAVNNDQFSFNNICYTAAKKREHHKYRLGVSGAGYHDTVSALNDFIAGTPSSSYAKGAEKNNLNQHLCFVFSGMGTQWAGMGKSLYQTEPVFKAEIDRCDAALFAYTQWSLIDVLFNESDSEKIHQTYLAQPCIFAIQIALAAQLKSWGVLPHTIVGHSAGEVGAAYVAGALSFDDAVKVVYHRSQLQHTTEGMGKMLAVGLSETELQPYLKGLEDKVSIGAINSDDAITLAGDEFALANIAERLEKKDIFARFLKVGVPYHSPVMDQLKAPLIAALKDIKVQTPHTQLFSTVSGKLTEGSNWDAEYWADNVREPVRFKDAIENILDLGINSFIEIAPHAALGSSVQKNLQKNNVDGICIPTLKRDQDAVLMLSQTIAGLHTQGISLNWDVLYPDGGSLVSLPNYAWQYSRYWSEAEEVQEARLKNITRRGGFGEPVHPLLGSQFNSSSHLWQRLIDLNDLTYISGHQVEQEIVYPGAAYIEMALAVASDEYKSDSYTLTGIEFKKALFLDQEKPSVIETIFDKSSGLFVINAVDPQTGEWSQYSQGLISNTVGTPSVESITPEILQAQLGAHINKAEFYEHCHSLGLTYIDDFQIVEQAWHSDTECLVEIRVPAGIVADNYFLHPIILDGAFQSIFPTLDAGFLPTKIAVLNFYKKPEGKIYAYLSTRFKDAESFLGDLLIISDTGDLLVEVLGVELKSTKTQGSTQTEDSILYDFSWRQEPFGDIAAATTNGHWIVFADTQGVGQQLAAEFRYRAHSVCLVEKGTSFEKLSEQHYRLCADSADELVSFLQQFSKNNTGIVYLWGSEHKLDDDQSADSVFDNSLEQTLSLVHVAQAMDKVEWKQTQKLFLITRGAQHITESENLPESAQAALWGFGRVFAAEHPEYQISMIDLISSVDDDAITQLAYQITLDQYEQEIAFNGSTRYVNRLRRLSVDNLHSYAKHKIAKNSDNIFYLDKISDEELKLVKGKNNEPAADDISIRVETSALSLEYVKTLIPQNLNVPAELLSHICVGTVINKGNGVNNVQVGDRVIALASHSHASQITLPAANVIQCDKSLDSRSLLAIATHFLTARYVLGSLVQLQQGERILIHDATEGVGLALLHLAKNQQVEIYATARSPEQKIFLAEQGVTHVFDADSHLLNSSIYEAAQGSGVDIILNANAHSLYQKTLSLLKPFGRWVDIGNADVTKNTGMMADFVKNNLSYHAINHTQLISHRPLLCLSLLRELLTNFSEHKISPEVLSHSRLQEISVESLKDVNEYFESDLGSTDLALIFNSANAPVNAGFLTQPVNAYSTYLVTGGLGGLGLEIMDWLVGLGAKSIVLIGRSSPTPDALIKINSARDKNVVVEVMRADVTNTSEIAQVFSTIQQNMLPLAGIIHSAGVLDDGIITQQTSEKFARVLAPKIKGTWNLHQLSRNSNLDFFVCFSSIASIVGWAGQSNYAAANAFMDSLAYRRRAQGLSALTINWGPWSGSGMAASLDDRDIQRMNDAGMLALSPDKGLAAMEQLLICRVPQAGVFELEWNKIIKQYPDPHKKSLFLDFVDNDTNEKAELFIDQLLIASVDTKAILLREKITEMLADVLGMESASAIDSTKNIFEYGMNSLMSMDFKNKLQATLKFKLPTTLVLKYPTVVAMTKYILDDLLENIEKEELASDILLWDPKQPEDVINHAISGALATYNPTLRVWFEQQKSAHFNVGFMIALNDQYFDKTVLQTTLDILFSYHDGSRLQIYKQDGEYKNQIAAFDGHVEIDTHDFRGMEYLNAANLIEENNNRLQASLSFDQLGYLYRVAYYQLDDEKSHRLFITFHHYLADGRSLRIFAADFERVYMQVYRKEAVHFPAKHNTLINWLEKLQDFATHEALDQVPYWSQTMQSASLCAFGRDFPVNPSRKSASWALSTCYSIDADIVSRIETLCTNEGIEVADFVNYSLIKALTNHTGTNVHWIDFVSHMRSGVFDNIEMPDVFGQLSDSIPTMFNLDEKLDIASAANSLRKQREAVPNSGLGMRSLVFNAPQNVITDLYYDNSKPKIVFNIDLSDYSKIQENNWFEVAKESFGTIEVMPEEVSNLPEIYIQVNFNNYTKKDGLSISAWCATDVYDSQRIAALIQNMGAEMEKFSEEMRKVKGVSNSETV